VSENVRVAADTVVTSILNVGGHATELGLKHGHPLAAFAFAFTAAPGEAAVFADA
jgi:hypothetical protein